MGAADVFNPDHTIHDPYRIEYLREHIQAIKDAIVEDGVQVFGYTPWGCIDLISCSTGQIDDAGQGTLNRYEKDSFAYYKRVIETNGEVL